MKRIVRKIHLCHQAGAERGTKEREMDVSGTPGIALIFPRIGSRTNREKAIDPFGIRQATTHTEKMGVKWTWPLVAFVQVATCCVRLPDFQERLWHWRS